MNNNDNHNMEEVKQDFPSANNTNTTKNSTSPPKTPPLGSDGALDSGRISPSNSSSWDYSRRLSEEIQEFKYFVESPRLPLVANRTSPMMNIADNMNINNNNNNNDKDSDNTITTTSSSTSTTPRGIVRLESSNAITELPSSRKSASSSSSSHRPSSVINSSRSEAILSRLEKEFNNNNNNNSSSAVDIPSKQIDPINAEFFGENFTSISSRRRDLDPTATATATTTMLSDSTTTSLLLSGGGSVVPGTLPPPRYPSPDENCWAVSVNPSFISKEHRMARIQDHVMQLCTMLTNEYHELEREKRHVEHKLLELKKENENREALERMKQFEIERERFEREKQEALRAAREEAEKIMREARELKEAVEQEKLTMQMEKDLFHSMQQSKVKLDIGGNIFTTTVSTLTKYEDSMFARMFSGRFPVQKDDQGCIFIDRDGSHFRYILNYLRDGRIDLPEDPLILNEIKREAEYYQLNALAAQIATCGVEGVDTRGYGSFDHDDPTLDNPMTNGIFTNNERILYFDNVKVLTGHLGAIRCLQLVGDTIVTGSDDKTIRMWNVHTGECFRTIVGHQDSVLCLQYEEDDILVSGSYDRTIRVWNMKKNGNARCIRILTGHTSFVTSLQLEGNTLVSCSDDTTIRIWDIETRECTSVLRGHSKPVWCIQFAGSTLVSGGDDNTVKIWDMDAGRCKKTLVGHRSTVLCLVYQQHERRVVSGSADKTIRVWNSDSGECLRIITGHTLAVKCLYILDSALASGSQDNTIKVWNLKDNGKCVRTLTGHDSFVNCLQFSKNTLVSGSSDKTVRVMKF